MIFPTKEVSGGRLYPVQLVQIFKDDLKTVLADIETKVFSVFNNNFQTTQT